MARDFQRFDFEVHSIRAGNCVVYVCNPNPEGEYVLWRDVAPYIKEGVELQPATSPCGTGQKPQIAEASTSA